MRILMLYFTIALFIGFFIIYITAPPPKVIIKYPNIKNPGKNLYTDDSNVCYKYRKIKIKNNKSKSIV